MNREMPFFRFLTGAVWRLSAMVFSVAMLSGAAGCGGDSGSPETHAKIFYFLDKNLAGVAAYGKYTLSDHSVNNADCGLSYRVVQTGVDENGGCLAPGPVVIDGETTWFEQCGTWDFVISDNGDVTRIGGFRYSGERSVMVARGIGWSLYISREDWGD